MILNVLDNVPLMATGSTSGHVALWDLEKRKVHSCLRDCHSGSVTGMKFLQNQPLMITSGQDNSLNVLVFSRYSFLIIKLLGKKR